MRPIDADALYNGTMKEEYFEFKAHDEDGRESFAYSCAMQRLAEAPTIDAIPVVHGRWILHDDELFPWFECSECGFTGMATRFCAGCGARMDGGEDDESEI